MRHSHTVLQRGWMAHLVGTGLCRHLSSQREGLQLRNARSRDRGGPCSPIPLQSFPQLSRGRFKLVGLAYCAVFLVSACPFPRTDSPDLILYYALPLQMLWELARGPPLPGRCGLTCICAFDIGDPFCACVTGW